MRKFKTMKSEWERYRAEVLKDITDPVELEERRVMFYSGMATMFHMAGELTTPDVTQEEGVAVLSTYEAEIIDFGETFKAQRAKAYAARNAS